MLTCAYERNIKSQKYEIEREILYLKNKYLSFQDFECIISNIILLNLCFKNTS